MPLEFGRRARHAKLDRAVVDLDISNDGALIAASIDARVGAPSVQVLRARDGATVASYGAETGSGYGVALAAGGREVWYLAEGDAGAKHLFRAPIAGGEAEQVAEYGLGERCHGLARDPEGERVAVLGNFVDVWNVEHAEVEDHLEGLGRERPVHAAFSADGTSLYTYGTVEGHVARYQLGREREVARWPAPSSSGQQLAVSPSDAYLAAIGDGAQGIFVVDLATGQRVAPGSFHESSLVVGTYAFSHDDSLLMWGVSLARAWRLDPGERIRGPELGSGRPLSIASARAAPLVAFGQDDGGLHWVGLREPAQRRRR